MLIATITLVAALAAVGVALAADATPGTTSTDIFVMGLQSDSSDTEVVAAYWPAAGGTSPDVQIPRTISGYGGYEFEASASGLSDGWAGAAVVSANKPVASVGELMIEGGSASDGMRAGYYNAFSEPSDGLYFPFVVYDRLGATGDIVQYSRFSIQNTSSSAADVYITYIDRDGTTNGPHVDSVPAMGATMYDLTAPGTGVPNLTTTAYWTANDFWTGAVVVTSTESVLAGALQNTWGDYSSAYSALSGGDEQIYLTNVERLLYDATAANKGKWEGLTSVVVQNFDVLNPVDVTVTFYSKTTAGTRSFTDTLPAGGAHGYNVRNGADTPGGAAFYQELAYWDDIPTGANPDLGDWEDGACLWVGSAVVEAEPGAEIAAILVGQKQRQGTASMFASATDGDAASTLYLPTTYRHRTGTNNHWNLLRIMNVGTGAAADVDFYFYNQDGSLAMSWLNQSAAQYAIVDAANLRTTAFSDTLGTSWTGTVVVESTQPVVGSTDVLWSADRFGAYNAIPASP